MAAKTQTEKRTFIQDEDGSMRLNPEAFAEPSGASGSVLVNLPAPHQKKQVKADEEIELINMSPGVVKLPDYARDVVVNKKTGEQIEIMAETGREKLVAPGQAVRTLAKFCVGRWSPFVVYEPDCKTNGFEYCWSEESVIAYFKRAISNVAFARARKDYMAAFKDWRGTVGIYFQKRQDEIDEDHQRRMMGTAG